MEKTLTTIVITLHDKSVMTVADSVELSRGSNALAQFLDKNTMKVVEDEKTTYIPFHAVIKVEATTSKQTVDPVEDDACKPVSDCPEETNDSTDDGGNGNG